MTKTSASANILHVWQGILDVPEDDVIQHVRLLTHLTHGQNTVPIAAIHPLATGWTM